MRIVSIGLRAPLWQGLLAVLLTGCGSATAPERFQRLLEDHWQNGVEEQVFFRSDPDAWRMNGKLPEFTPEARARRHRFNDEILSRLGTIDVGKLDSADQLSFRIFRYERLAERDSYEQFDRFFPITSLTGYHTYFAEAPAAMAFLTAEDYEKYLISLADFPRYNAEHIALLQEAINAGYTHYCDSIADYDRTIRAHIVEDAKESALYTPFRNFPSALPAASQADLSTRGAALIESAVVPGFRELLEFFRSRYLPACRTAPGITSLDGGLRYYEYLIRYFTTTDLTPEDIHRLGLAEVERIRAEMQDLITAVGFDGGFRAFLDSLRTDPGFYAKSVPELLGRAALLAKTAEGELPKYFRTLPRGTYNIKPNPSRGTFYRPSSGDGTTPGTYFLAADRLDAQPLYTLEALTLHEAVPGHHLQTALAMELELPDFRRQLYHSGFGEGWALYAEFLGKEMGFYQDPYSDFGRLTYEIWRACRLVVDTGLHAFGWSRRQAIDYLLDNTALSEREIEREVDRYITWPAQALAYKLGELKIKELRHRVERALGERFDLRAFHDIVIGNGSLPIAILEEVVAAWLADETGS